MNRAVPCDHCMQTHMSATDTLCIPAVVINEMRQVVLGNHDRLLLLKACCFIEKTHYFR